MQRREKVVIELNSLPSEKFPGDVQLVAEGSLNYSINESSCKTTRIYGLPKKL